MLPCSKNDLIIPVSKDIEGLLKQQLGEDFALLEITTKFGKRVHLRSNSIEAIEIQNESFLPKKRITLNDLNSESRITYSGSPRCEIRKKAGSLVIVNLDGGPVSDCYQ